MSGLTRKALLHTHIFQYHPILECGLLLRQYVSNLIANSKSLFFCSFLHRSTDCEMALVLYCEGTWVHFNFSAMFV